MVGFAPFFQLDLSTNLVGLGESHIISFFFAISFKHHFGCFPKGFVNLYRELVEFLLLEAAFTDRFKSQNLEENGNHHCFFEKPSGRLHLGGCFKHFYFHPENWGNDPI